MERGYIFCCAAYSASTVSTGAGTMGMAPYVSVRFLLEGGGEFIQTAGLTEASHQSPVGKRAVNDLALAVIGNSAKWR